MEGLINDIIIYIMTFLRDNEKIKFLSLSKSLNYLKNKVYYDEMIDIGKISRLSYYDMFTNVIIIDFSHSLPNSIKKITFNNNMSAHPHINNLFTMDEAIDRPNSVIAYNKNMILQIPNTVTHLIFNDWFDQDIR